jgi:hypothetical protein
LQQNWLCVFGSPLFEKPHDDGAFVPIREVVELTTQEVAGVGCGQIQEGGLTVGVTERFKRGDGIAWQCSQLQNAFHKVLVVLDLRGQRGAVGGRGVNVKTSLSLIAGHFHTAPVQQDYIRPAGCCLVECPKCGAGEGVWCLTDGPTPNGKRPLLHEERWKAAGKYSSVGWHTFRHTYRSWLDDTGAPVGVQQKLMRHAQISTTMNVYGNALMDAKREANSKVVRRALRSA